MRGFDPAAHPANAMEIAISTKRMIRLFTPFPFCICSIDEGVSQRLSAELNSRQKAPGKGGFHFYVMENFDQFASGFSVFANATCPDSRQITSFGKFESMLYDRSLRVANHTNAAPSL